jgi:Phytanoyl-CoA dioxygenase (PhyH)
MNEVSPSGAILDEKRVVDFRENGMLLVEGFYDLACDVVPIQEGIYEIIGQVMTRHDVPDKRKPFSSESFDDGYNSLIAIDRTYGGEVYDAVKQIPAFVRLIGHPTHERIFKELRPGAIPGVAAGGYGIRIDNPSEERFRAPWHQEYPAQLRSIDGLAFWSPLISMSPELGPVEFCLGSHREGLVPVHTRDPKNPEKSGAYALTLKNEENLVRRYKKVSPLAKPGDLIVIDFLVLHSSGYNVSKRSRWSMQFRYFNFNEPTGRRHGWKGSFASGFDFRTAHPDLCVD